MSPKRARDRSPLRPTRRAPTRDAKTRSAASTASMYHKPESYLGSTSDDMSDQISDPEDTASEMEAQGSGNNTDEESYISDEPVKTRSGKAQRNTSTRTSSRSASNNSVSTSAGGRRPQRTLASAKAQPKAGATKLTTRKVVSATNASPVSSAAPKRKASNLKFLPLGSSPASSISSSKSKPIRASSSDRLAAGLNRDDDQWNEKYAPTSIGEIAVNPSKINDVRRWLEMYTDPRNRHQDTSGGAILVLSGPAGSGKTTVLRLLAQEMGLHVLEWTNVVNENNIIQRAATLGEEIGKPSSVDEEYVPVMRAFQEFFSRAQRFSPLATTRDSLQQTQSPMASALSGDGKKNIILIEDLPPVAAFSSRKIFQDTIARYANSRTHIGSVLVIIMSDVFTKQSTELLFSNTSESRDPVLAVRTLLPSTVVDRMETVGRGSARLKQIKFNPIAKTFMYKALKKLIAKEFSRLHTCEPDEDELEQTIQIHEGDIRAVINSLQFLCHLPSKRRKVYKNAASKLEDEQEGLHSSEDKMTTGQDSSLGFFHAAGRVLYNRRDWSAPYVEFDSDMVRIPPQSWSKRRPPLRFNPEQDLIEKLPMDPELYTLMLHQNYMRHMKTIDECQTAMEYLCIADQFSHSSSTSDFYGQKIQMQPYMTSVAVRGLLFAPTSAGPASASGGGQRKHWWPELYAVNRTMRANEQLYADAAADLAGDETLGLSAGHITGSGVLSKRVVREELVPMLHSCVKMNPYMAVFSKSLRPSSKTFIRTGAAGFGKRFGMVKKEFGEGDEGFLEEVENLSDAGEAGRDIGVDEIVDNVGLEAGARKTDPSADGKDARFKLQQQKQQLNPLAYQLEHDDDPIEDFSD